MSSEWSGSVVTKETQVVKNEKRRRVDNQIVLALLRPEVWRSAHWRTKPRGCMRFLTSDF